MDKELKEKYHAVMRECIAKLQDLTVCYKSLRNVPSEEVDKIIRLIEDYVKQGNRYLSEEVVYKEPYKLLEFGFHDAVWRRITDEWRFDFRDLINGVDLINRDNRIALDETLDELLIILGKFNDLDRVQEAQMAKVTPILRKEYDNVTRACIGQFKKLIAFYQSLTDVSLEERAKILHDLESEIRWCKFRLADEGIYDYPYEEHKFSFDRDTYNLIEAEWRNKFRDNMSKEQSERYDNILDELIEILSKFSELRKRT